MDRQHPLKNWERGMQQSGMTDPMIILVEEVDDPAATAAAVRRRSTATPAHGDPSD